MEIPPALLNGVGVGALLVLLFWMLATERLVTGPAHKRELDDRDKQIAKLEADRAMRDETIERLTNATQSLAVSANTSSTALRQIAKAAEANSTGGDE